MAAFHVYTKFQHSLAHKLLDLQAPDTIKCALLSTYTGAATNVQSAQFQADVITSGVGVEISSSGYTAGGAACTGVSITDSGAVTTLNATGPSWTGLTASPAFALFYDSTPGTAASNPVICYWDFGGAQSLTAANFQINVSASGLVTLTAS